MANYILDKAYQVTDQRGVPAYRVVVHGPEAGQCALPKRDNAGSILGVTVHAQECRGQNVAVRKAGIARVEAAAAMSLGAPVYASVGGFVAQRLACCEPRDYECLGFAETAAEKAGDIIEVFISMHQRTL